MFTFPVSDVARSESRLPAATLVAQLAGLGWKTTEAHSIGWADGLVDAAYVHPLALAVHLAFETHQRLVLTPDAVWLCLAQSLATHVDIHAGALRSRLVRHEGQLALEQRRDDFTRGAHDNDWPSAVDGLTAKISEHAGGRADLFVADFSTTTREARAASQVALMGAMRQYFRYSVSSLCGIPEITLEGTPDDWSSMRKRVAAFEEFDLAWWVAVLDPVLAKIEETARGAVDRDFWRAMYKSEHQSGGDRSCGWLSTFFAYVGDPPTRNAFPAIDAGDFEGHKLSDYPSGRTRVPFVWRIQEERLAMELVGGMFGVSQAADGALGVAIGWLVADAREESGFTRSPGTEDWPAALRPRLGISLETLAGLVHEAGDEPVMLTLHRASALRSIEGVEHLRGLVEFAATDAPLLTSVASLVGARSLRRLDLSSCPNLVGLGPLLASLPNLESLSLMRNPQLTLADLAAIATMPHLKHLSLWHCEGLPPELRVMHASPEAIEAVRRAVGA